MVNFSFPTVAQAFLDVSKTDLLPTHPHSLSPLSWDRGGVNIEVSWARHLDEVREAQRLRFDIFGSEIGAVFATSVPGHDVDVFDDYCEHLLVRDGRSGEVIGTYRVLSPVQAQRVGSFYIDTEFDVANLSKMRARMVELGRSCVHAKYRHGGVIMALWGALFEFMQRNGLDVMVGCASIPMQLNGVVSAHVAASIWHQLRQTHLAPPQLRVRPHSPLPVDEWGADLKFAPPALVKGYLRLGAKILGAPAWDQDFNTADLPMLLQLSDLPAKYRRHFLTGA